MKLHGVLGAVMVVGGGLLVSAAYSGRSVGSSASSTESEASKSKQQVADPKSSSNSSTNGRNEKESEGIALGEIKFRPCTLSSSQMGEANEARCATFQVPEDHQKPEGRKIELNVVWIPASEPGAPVSDPLFMIAGGPGQSSVEAFGAAAKRFSRVLEHRHILLVDQRGTGKSNPLKCKESETLTEKAKAILEIVDHQKRKEERQKLSVQSLSECKAELEKHSDLRFYSTTDAVHDLERVRQAIGAESINLYGVSYGTRVAQQYGMRFPEHTRTITLDSVVPNAIYLGNIWAKNLDEALEQQFALCEKSPDCKNKFGDTREKLRALKTTLQANPPVVNYRDPVSGEEKKERLHYEEVAGLVRMYAYMPTSAALLPLQIHEASEGRFATIKALAEILGGAIGDMMAMGMQFSVVCSEDGDNIKPSPEDHDTVLGNELTETMLAACKIWPRGRLPEDFHEPLRGDIPTLVIQGELDPVTPPKFGNQVAKELAKVKVLTLRGQGHGVIAQGCMPKVFAAFLQSADPEGLDVECLSKLDYTPPFVSFNGWGP